MSEINARQGDLRSFLYAQRYQIEYYQREYTWGANEIVELLDDLTHAFSESYDENESNGRNVENYEKYFLGSFIVSTKRDEIDPDDTYGKFVVDGQQRLTSLMLLFLYLGKINKDEELSKYVRSKHYGEEEFVISTPDRKKVLNYILDSNQEITTEGFNEVSEKNIINNYKEIQNFFEEAVEKGAFDNKKIKFFTYWLERCVFLVEISVGSDESAYHIFEAMNTRGKDLTNAEMLKGFLVSMAGDKKKEALSLWEKIYYKFSTESEFDDFMGIFIRGRFITDFDLTRIESLKKSGYYQIESTYYTIIKKRQAELLSSQEQLFDFIKGLDFYSDLYISIKKKTESCQEGDEEFYYLNLAYPKNWIIPFFSLISPEDPKGIQDTKTQIIINYLDLFSGVSFFGGRKLKGGEGNHLTLMNVIRVYCSKNENPKTDEEIISFQYYLYQSIVSLYSRVKNESKESLSSELLFSSSNRETIKYILLRLSNLLELQSAKADMYTTYNNSKYEIEHLLARDYEINDFNKSEFIDEQEFAFWRSKIGALGILDKSTNSAFKDASYSEKVKNYPKHNRLLGLLSKDSYQSDGKLAYMPGLNKMIKNNPQLLPYIKPHEKLGKEEILQREALFNELAKILWNPNRLLESSHFESAEETLAFCEDIFGETEVQLELNNSTGRKVNLKDLKGKEMFMEVDNARFEFDFYGHSNGIVLKTIEKCPLIKDVGKLFIELPGLAGVGDAYNKIIADSNTTIENGRFSWTGEMRVPARTPIFFMAGDSADSITYKGEKLMMKSHYHLRR